MNFWVADPDWGFWIVAYFFLGGIAAGSYFIAILMEWFGSEEDLPLARIAYWIAFPLTVLCGLFLVVDLHRPEVSELLSDRSVPARHPRCRCNGLHIRHRFDLRSVATAKIARLTRAPTSPDQT